MTQRLKWIFCLTLAAVAMLCLVATAADIGVLEAKATGGDEFLIRQSAGRVCVYRMPDTRTPLFEADVDWKSLPAAARAELTLGVGAEDAGDLRQILAHYGA